MPTLSECLGFLELVLCAVERVVNVLQNRVDDADGAGGGALSHSRAAHCALASLHARDKLVELHFHLFGRFIGPRQLRLKVFKGLHHILSVVLHCLRFATQSGDGGYEAKFYFMFRKENQQAFRGLTCPANKLVRIG